jgi:hypothetical protein
VRRRGLRIGAFASIVCAAGCGWFLGIDYDRVHANDAGDEPDTSSPASTETAPPLGNCQQLFTCGTGGPLLYCAAAVPCTEIAWKHDDRLFPCACDGGGCAEAGLAAVADCDEGSCAALAACCDVIGPKLESMCRAYGTMYGEATCQRVLDQWRSTGDCPH